MKHKLQMARMRIARRKEASGGVSRLQLSLFLEQHDPERLGQLDQIMAFYPNGRELRNVLHKRYGAWPVNLFWSGQFPTSEDVLVPAEPDDSKPRASRRINNEIFTGEILTPKDPRKDEIFAGKVFPQQLQRFFAKHVPDKSNPIEVRKIMKLYDGR